MDGRATRAGVCFFRSEGRGFAVELDALEEVADLGALVPVPMTPPAVLGLQIHRRTVVPVVDPSVGPGDRRGEATPILLVLRSEHGPWGLRVDRAGLVIVDKTVPMLGPPQGPLDDGLLAVQGELEHGGQVHRLIDGGRTWCNVREQVEAWHAGPRRRAGGAMSGSSSLVAHADERIGHT
jgi:chemotaxis signal transduction protein